MVGNAFFIVFFLLLWHSVAIEFNSLTVSKNTQICFILCFILLFLCKNLPLKPYLYSAKTCFTPHKSERAVISGTELSDFLCRNAFLP